MRIKILPASRFRREMNGVLTHFEKASAVRHYDAVMITVRGVKTNIVIPYSDYKALKRAVGRVED